MPQRSLSLEISDAAIRRYAADPDIRELNDSRHPYRFRYDRRREGGSWHLVRSVKGKKHWRKIGAFPALTTKALKAALPTVMARLAAEPGATATIGTMATVNDVLTWYRNRLTLDRNMTAKRKDTVRSAIKCHLQPALGGFQLVELTRANIDSQLLWPMQARYSLAHTRLVFQVMKSAFKRAERLGIIDHNPMAGRMFSDSVAAKIAPKAMRMQREGIQPLFAELVEQFKYKPAQVALVVMMLAHGSRIGETRRAKWSHISRERWHVPAEATKSSRVHNLPMTDQVWSFLERYRAQQKARGYDGAWLFPGARTGRPITERQASEMFADQGAGEWTSHDLRKLARSTWLDLGIDTLIGDLLLNHKIQGVRIHYIHTHAEERKRHALELWHGWLDDQGFTALHG